MNHCDHHNNPQQHSGRFYTCPMHPEIQRESGGICPECGMTLTRINPSTPLGSARDESPGAGAERYADQPLDLVRGRRGTNNHDKHAGHSTKMFLRKFWVSFVLTIPVVLYSDLVQKFFALRLPTLEIGNWKLEILIPAALGSVVFFYGGWVFVVGAWRELKAQLPGMMTLIALAISAAYAYSIYSTIAGLGETLFWELTTLITIMLLGHWLEMKAVSGAQGALKELSKLLPDTAEVILEKPDFPGKSGFQGLETRTALISELVVGNMVLVRPGGRIPSDAVVIEGQSETNESMITGESRPVKKTVGSEVIAGTINGDGALKIKVTKIGQHTFLAGVMRLVEEAQASKSRLQILSDRAAFYLTVIAIGTGGLTFILWILAKAGWGFALERLVAVLVIACPHALGLAVPLVASISTTLAARHGFLVRQRLALEIARKVDVVLFDKTGTLTKGEYGLTRIITNDPSSITDDELLRLAASVDSHSEHFIAKAIVAEAKKRDLDLKEVKNFQRLAGRGVKGEVDGKTIWVGGESILTEINPEIGPNLRSATADPTQREQTFIYVVADKTMLGILALSDIIREESRQAIGDLAGMGIKTAMVTGDSEEVAKWVARELGIDEYYARVLPGEKAEIVKKLQAPIIKSQINPNDQNPKRFRISDLGFRNPHKRIAFVGDGINDAPALTQADLGIAIGAGTNVAIESAGIILVKNDPRDIAKIIKLSRMTYRKMIQNLFWAAGYNVAAIPLAAGILASKGVLLQPAFSAVLMSLSTVIVAFNAILLKRAGTKIS